MSIVPDYESIVVDAVQLPFDNKRKFVRARFADSLLEGYEVIVVEDSVDGFSSVDSRLTTDIWRFPRSILAEINTHRVFSRNSASSRARSVGTTIKSVVENPFIPVFTQNQRGMSGQFVEDARYVSYLTGLWLASRDRAVDSCLDLLLGERRNPSQGVSEELAKYAELYKNDDSFISPHKQIVNRIIEPFMWHEAVVTSSYWDNFLELRTANDAEPSIRALALLVKKAHEVSVPQNTVAHIPFVSSDDKMFISGDFAGSDKDTLMKSAFNAAQVSYHDKSRERKNTATLEKGLSLMKSKHWSPFEHIAYNVDFLNHARNFEFIGSGNFSPRWVQFRQLCESFNLSSTSEC